MTVSPASYHLLLMYCHWCSLMSCCSISCHRFIIGYALVQAFETNIMYTFALNVGNYQVGIHTQRALARAGGHTCLRRRCAPLQMHHMHKHRQKFCGQTCAGASPALLYKLPQDMEAAWPA